ncbi:MAG: hypothetical protein M3Z05_18770 [Gemmatimonadota bacterium]|nr:hypothetical protein [Gemmatimonadota bacterium]
MKITNYLPYFIGFLIAAMSMVPWLAYAADPTPAVGPTAAGITDVLLQHGITGALLLIAMYAYWRKDQDKNAESAARIADAKLYGEAMAGAREKQSAVIERFTDTSEALLEEIKERQREERASTLQRPATGQGFKR